jgi:hypothetical protein
LLKSEPADFLVEPDLLFPGGEHAANAKATVTAAAMTAEERRRITRFLLTSKSHCSEKTTP